MREFGNGHFHGHPRTAAAAAYGDSLPARWALGLRLIDFDAMRGLVRLTEKGGTLRWQPISLDLAGALTDHARARGAVLPVDLLLRYRDGRPLTSRRCDQLWHRICQLLPWVAAQAISTHWLRHTILTWVERHYGYGVARAYAEHKDSTGPATTTYIKADLHAVATAPAALTGQPHPLAISARMSSPHKMGIVSAVMAMRHSARCGLRRATLPLDFSAATGVSIGIWR